MYPQIDIQKVRDRYFNYGVSIGNADACYWRHGLGSVAECLHDAATALGTDFPVAAICYAGRALGRYQVADMEHKTLALVDSLEAQLARLPESEATA